MTKEKTNSSLSTFLEDWKTDLISRAKTHTKSKKVNYSIYDAILHSKEIRTELDEALIIFFNHVTRKPLSKNDYFKYVNAYRHGKELDLKYFRHDVDQLKAYYSLCDANKDYNPFDKYLYEKYVLFMVLKFSKCYLPIYDKMFNVKIEGSREYNPLTQIPKVLRSELPFEIKEYDIAQANPSFIFLELGIEPFNVYERIEKRKFNMLLNIHHEVKNAKIEDVRKQLEPIYHDRVNEVITNDRFNNKGRLFEDMAKHEKFYIEQFVNENNLQQYVRLHDGVVTLASHNCEKLEFGNIKFKVKEFTAPEVLEGSVNFYDSFGNTSPHQYANFLKQEGFIRLAKEGQDEVILVKNTNKIIEPYSHKTDLVSFLKSNINELDTSELENTIAKEATTKIKDSLLLLDPIPLTYHRDTRTRVDIPFKNGVVRITSDEIKLIPYSEINGFFPKHTTQKTEIEITDREAKRSEFEEFLTLASCGNNYNEEVVNSFFSMFGYLISNHKDLAKNYAIILSDEGADGENRNGGRGKSIVQTALSYFRPTIFKGGEEYDPSYIHVHADLEPEHDIYYIDDVPRSFNYNALYTNISNAIFCQRKGTRGNTIPFEYTPKFVISTNWAFRYDKEASSTNRRFREYKFTNYWNIENTPLSHFGKTFFSDWSAKEWNAFFNFGFYCVQVFLNNGLRSIDYDKRGDNFLAYFSNDAKLQEMERVLEELKYKDFFNVSDFLMIHKQSILYQYQPIFNQNNAKQHIQTYIEFKELGLEYVKHSKVWKKV